MGNRYTLILEHYIDSAHKLNLDYESPCQRIHGHRWKIVTEIITDKLDKNGMIIDFKKIKEVINKLDHQDLNKIVKFNPTAENLSQYLYQEIQKEVNGTAEIKITIFESPNASITYEET